MAKYTDENFYVKLDSYDIDYDNPIIDVTISVDMSGLAKIMELDAESRKLSSLAENYGELAEIQREIEAYTEE